MSPVAVSKYLGFFSGIGDNMPGSDSGESFYSYKKSVNFDFGVITSLFSEDGRLLIMLLVFMI